MRFRAWNEPGVQANCVVRRQAFRDRYRRVVCGRLRPVCCRAVADLLVDVSAGPTTIKPNSDAIRSRAPEHCPVIITQDARPKIKKSAWLSLSPLRTPSFRPVCFLFAVATNKNNYALVSTKRKSNAQLASLFSLAPHFCRIIPTASGVAAFKDKCTHEKKAWG